MIKMKIPKIGSTVKNVTEYVGRIRSQPLISTAEERLAYQQLVKKHSEVYGVLNESHRCNRNRHIG